MSENKKHLGLLGPAPTQAELSQAVRGDQQTLIGKVLSVCESLQVENEKQRQETERLYLIQAIREYKLRPKKPGRKPKPKTEMSGEFKKPGRPQKFTDKTHELMIELVDTLKERYGFKTDQEALQYFLAVNCVESGRYKSKRIAIKQLNSLKIQLCRARRKRRQITD